MNAAPLDPQRPAETLPADEVSWSIWRWLGYIALAFALHVGLFYFLGDRNPIQTRPVKQAAALQITESQSELQQLDDPTLFALPHPRGFAAATWLRLPQIPFAPFRWTEPPRLLPLPVEQLGTIFLRRAETNAPAIREIAAISAPMTTVVAPLENESRRSVSTLRISGAVAGRKLRQRMPALPLLPAQDSLTNTMIKVLVDARGQVLSPTLFHPGSGSKDADQTALKIARNLWFRPAPKTTPPLSGWLIFEWAMAPATNAPGSTP